MRERRWGLPCLPPGGAARRRASALPLLLPLPRFAGRPRHDWASDWPGRCTTGTTTRGARNSSDDPPHLPQQVRPEDDEHQEHGVPDVIPRAHRIAQTTFRAATRAAGGRETARRTPPPHHTPRVNAHARTARA